MNRSAEDLYRFWRDLENLPRVMRHVVSVTETSGGRSHWVGKGPAGTSVAWDAVITDDRPGESLAWRSEPGSQIPNEGAVGFRRVNQHSTDVIVSLTYHPPGGAVGATVARLLGEEPAQQVREDLERFKEEVEADRLSLDAPG